MIKVNQNNKLNNYNKVNQLQKQKIFIYKQIMINYNVNIIIN